MRVREGGRDGNKPSAHTMKNNSNISSRLKSIGEHPVLRLSNFKGYVAAEMQAVGHRLYVLCIIFVELSRSIIPSYSTDIRIEASLTLFRR